MLSLNYMKKNTVKCKYSFCLHESRELNKDEAVKIGNQYFHKDCLQTKNEIKEIIDLFVKHINPNPVYSQLQATIKNIVFTQGLGSQFLLFGLKYYISNKIPLNYPQGLYYVIQNKDVKAEFEKYKAKEIKKAQIKAVVTQETEKEFEFKPTKQRGFADILGGR